MGFLQGFKNLVVSTVEVAKDKPKESAMLGGAGVAVGAGLEKAFGPLEKSGKMMKKLGSAVKVGWNEARATAGRSTETTETTVKTTKSTDKTGGKD